ASKRIYGALDSFPVASMTPPARFEITPCRYELENLAHFKPTASGQVDQVVFLSSPSGDLRRFEFDDGLRSPDITEMRYFSLSGGDGDLVCGPPLRTRRRDQVSRFDAIVVPEARIRRLNDHVRLL